jgi:pimeloyl-ACP methyl ester carboxylesterase
LIAAGNENLNGHYWYEKKEIPKYYGYFSEAQFQFNFNSFKSIRETCSRNLIHRKTSLETVVIYGQHDPFISADESFLVENFYLKSKFFLIEGASHYPHIEKQERFLEICLENESEIDFNNSNI